MKPSVRNRLEKLEREKRFMHWFLETRFRESLMLNERYTFFQDGKFPDPLPNRSSKLDGLDRDSLVARWEEEQQILGDRTIEELQRYCETGLWPEQVGKLHYSIKNGGLYVELKIDEEEGKEHIFKPRSNCGPPQNAKR
jgi:hypothetical protein